MPALRPPRLCGSRVAPGRSRKAPAEGEPFTPTPRRPQGKLDVRRGAPPSVRGPAIALILLLPLLAGLASAQVGVIQSGIAVSVEDPGRAFTPGAIESVSILVSYRVSPGAMPTPDPNRNEATVPTNITFAVKQLPSWVIDGRFEPDYMLLDPQVGGGTSSGHIALLLNISPDAPALQREDIIVTATAAENGNIASSSGESAPVKLRAGISPKLNVTGDTSLVIVGGGRWNLIPFTVRNDGNSEVTAKLNVTLRPEDSQVEAPATLVLKPGESQIVEVRLRMPWTYAQRGEVELEAIPLVGEDEEGAAATGLVEVQAMSAVPGAPLAWLLGALAAVGLLRRR